MVKDKEVKVKKSTAKKKAQDDIKIKVVSNKRIHITKVVSRNFLMDIWAQFQNLVGSNLTAYERMVDKAFEQIDDHLIENEIDLAWYRHEISQLTNGAVVVVLYGEAK